MFQLSIDSLRVAGRFLQPENEVPTFPWRVGAAWATASRAHVQREVQLAPLSFILTLLITFVEHA